MVTLEEKILSKVGKKQSVLWGYIGNAFFVWGHDKEFPKEFIN